MKLAQLTTLIEINLTDFFLCDLIIFKDGVSTKRVRGNGPKARCRVRVSYEPSPDSPSQFLNH